MRSRTIILLLASLFLLSCSPRALHEAQDVVAQADSLRAEGQMYNDSTRLAQAYATLDAIPLPFRKGLGLGSLYAHACYHYGRLLRERENPVEAMQVFICATHANTHDYHILGRVYSNMGSICHLANEFQLSYDMFVKAADCFLLDGDTSFYYYALNEVAFELAEQGKKEEAYFLIDSIAKNCTESAVLSLSTVAKAIACKKVAQYDSVLFYTSKAIKVGNTESHILLLRAQAYSFLEIKDSAVYYANQVLSVSGNLYEQNNALYILTNDDDSQSILECRENASDRADTQKIIEEKRSKLSQAVQLLEQDIHRQPNRSWLYAVFGTMLVIGSIIAVYVSRKRSKHQLLSQHIDALETQTEETTASIRKQIEEHCAILQNSATLKEDLCWHNYDAMCQIVDHQFYFLARKLQQTYNLSDHEIQLCVLTLLDLSYDQIAELLIYAPNGIGKFKVRVAKKLGTTAKNLREFLINMAIGG